jgi:GNAT superfamily N-acetyltransferase
VELVEASEAQKRERDVLTHSAWGERLTPQGYAAREQRLRAHPWARASMQTWLLEQKGTILSSCETFRTPAHLGAQQGEAWAVASVFTEKALRGRGHAERMMRLLCERLGQLPGHPLAVVLFSDVGPSLYARAGFVARPAVDWRFEPLRAPPAAQVDALLPEERLAGELARVRPPPGRLVLLPTALRLDWHLERERIYAEQLGRPRPVACGARVGSARAFWAATLKTDSLHVLLLDAERPEEARALLRAARAVAHQAQLAEVRLWEDPAPPPWVEGLGEGQRLEREGSLPMLAPLDGRVQPAGWQQVPRALWV